MLLLDFLVDSQPRWLKKKYNRAVGNQHSVAENRKLIIRQLIRFTFLVALLTSRSLTADSRERKLRLCTLHAAVIHSPLDRLFLSRFQSLCAKNLFAIFPDKIENFVLPCRSVPAH